VTGVQTCALPIYSLLRRDTGEARGVRHDRALDRTTGRVAGRAGSRRNDRGAESRRSAPHGPDAQDATRPDPRGDPCAQMTEAVCPPSSGPGSRPVSLGGDRLLTTGVHLEPSRQAARLEDRSDIALEAD